MNGILDQMLVPRQYTPASIHEYVALQIAKRFQDGPAVQRYIRYVMHIGLEPTLQAYATAALTESPVSAFHSSLSPEP